MSIGYTAVQWSRQKRRYDAMLALGIVMTIATYCGVSLALRPQLTFESLLLRSTALAAFFLLHVILCVGPLARLDRRFLPLLYNRRHLGVVMFLLALVHAVMAVVQFHAFAPGVNPLVSVFTAYAQDYRPVVEGANNLAHLPFEPFGALALSILFVMASTSHDFWLRNLGPNAWKSLHLAVLVAYGALIIHVSYGVLQSETSVVFAGGTAVGLLLVVSLHAIAGWRERSFDREETGAAKEGFVPVARLKELREGRGRVVKVGPSRIALFLHQGRPYATSNVCRHQGGPVGEGRILDGCITCPWHGWQYRPEDGISPPPFEERIETYEVEVVDDEVRVRVDGHRDRDQEVTG